MYHVVVSLIVASPTGKQLANAAVNLRVTSSSSSSGETKPSSGATKGGGQQNPEKIGPTQKALDLLDVNDAQAGERSV